MRTLLPAVLLPLLLPTSAASSAAEGDAFRPAVAGGSLLPRAVVQGTPADSTSGEFLRVSVLTIGQGDLVWEKFGHNAIRIVDTRDGTDVAWNWGLFTFTQEGFWPRLVRGEMLYSMGGYATDATLRQYRAANRPVWEQELDLTPEQKWRLRNAVLEHYRPENRQYLYDYYRDNCSTRVRDMLDLALDGAISNALRDDTTSTTYRWHTRRLLAGSPLAYAGIQLVLGHRADRPITAWEEGFLPMRLRDHLREVTVQVDGRARPLVRSEVQLVRSDRPPTPGQAPSRLGWFGSVGLALAGLVAALGAWASRESVAGRVAWAVVAVLWSAATGAAGALILGAWLFTAHVFWGLNENLLQADPASLVLAAAFLPVLWRGRVGARAAALAATVAALSALGFLLQVFPALDQVNGEIIALALPVNLTVGWTAVRLSAPRPEGSDDRAAAAAAGDRALAA
ncbi:MAG: DUF4105 domain-containing protein [Gemmatimonadota bacterium]